MNETPSSDARKSIPSLLWGILARPRATLAHLRDHQPKAWVVPAILILICIVLPVLASRSASGAAPDRGNVMMPMEGAVVVEAPMVEGKGGGIVDPGMGGPTEPTRTASPLDTLKTVASLLGTPLSWLLWGAALYLVSVFLGRSSGFKPMARLAVWAGLPYAVRGLVQAIFMWITKTPIANSGFAGFVIDSSAPSLIQPGPGTVALASVLSRVDLFLVWNLVLLVIGLRAFTGLPRRKSIIAVLVVWIVLALLGIIPAIVGGLLTPIGA